MTASTPTVTHGWRTPENILNIVKIVAIFVAAGWAVYLFIRFDATEKELSVALLESDNLRAKFQSELDQLQVQRSKLEIAQSEAATIVIEQEIEVTDLGPTDGNDQHLFMVSYGYTITNVGSSSLEVTYVLIRALRSTIPVPGNGKAIQIGSIREKSGLTWNPIFVKGHYYGPKWEEGSKTEIGGDTIMLIKGGGGTSELDSKESSEGSLELAILGGAHDLVGFETRIGIDGGEEARNRLRNTEICLLMEANTSVVSEEREQR